MIAPAPLPGLPVTLSRRAAVFGAVTVATVPAGPVLAAPRWDADLVALGARLRMVMDGARRALESVPAGERDAHNERLDHADSILSRMAELDADSLAGLCAKAAAFDFAAAFDLQEGWNLGHSLALDVLRAGRAGA